ncbi:MAG: glutamine synthetase III [Candidatus Margulisiibacteriota bacterium]
MNVRQTLLNTIKVIELEKQDELPNVTSYFGENTFSIAEIENRVSKNTFESFQNWIEKGVTINQTEANEIAEAMKTWAIEKGAIFYTHWFQPMTGLTAEKHDSFINPIGGGKIVEEFKGSNLIQGEPDASSFPSGGIRTTFEARGYTAWDPSSPAFIIENKLGKTLCIPTIFVSYNGESLDKKLPLLRSDVAINKSALNLLNVFGSKATKVYSTCGPEQEYFLIDEKYYKLRQDLLMAGRTLTGAGSPKDQQLEDQYFGSIKERMLEYMHEVGTEAYKLGIPLKTRHNEVAPHQYEFAPVYEESNLAADHNQLLMDIMKKIAKRHGLVCLLHEKPFAGINGSGKHLNWSLADDLGNNLLNPGKTPEANLQFLAVLAAILRAVHKHSDLLRASVASAGNEHRLGANEAPPAIISVFLGKQLSDILDTIEKGATGQPSKQDIMDLGVGRLPKFNKDNTDRNRTSPFAFTGAKFEFRALGSAQNISTPIMVVNTIIAESLDYVADKIKAVGGDVNAAALKVITEIVKESKAIRFEGNNYAESWVEEAAKRGLPNEPSTTKALEALIKPENIALFEKYSVLTKEELQSRYNIWVDIYVKTLEIEAHTLRDIVDSNIVPAGLEYQSTLSKNLVDISSLIKDGSLKLEKNVHEDLSGHLADISAMIYYVRRNTRVMEELMEKSEKMSDEEKAELFFTELKPIMAHIRKHADALERVIPDEHWELPKYREMLFVE